MTAILNQRQRTAQALAREIESLGAWVTSPLPLDDGKRLRFQLLDGDKNRVLQAISDLGFEPRFVSILPRVTFVGLAAACCYEVALAPERQFVVDDRHSGELAKKEKPHEVDAIVQEFYGLKRR
jgi:hypothetical protein